MEDPGHKGNGSEFMRSESSAHFVSKCSSLCSNKESICRQEATDHLQCENVAAILTVYAPMVLNTSITLGCGIATDSDIVGCRGVSQAALVGALGGAVLFIVVVAAIAMYVAKFVSKRPAPGPFGAASPFLDETPRSYSEIWRNFWHNVLWQQSNQRAGGPPGSYRDLRLSDYQRI